MGKPAQIELNLMYKNGFSVYIKTSYVQTWGTTE